jgi:hypothetical protein
VFFRAELAPRIRNTNQTKHHAFQCSGLSPISAPGGIRQPGIAGCARSTFQLFKQSASSESSASSQPHRRIHFHSRQSRSRLRIAKFARGEGGKRSSSAPPLATSQISAIWCNPATPPEDFALPLGPSGSSSPVGPCSTGFSLCSSDQPSRKKHPTTIGRRRAARAVL